jgi:hypothetical protein
METRGEGATGDAWRHVGDAAAPLRPDGLQPSRENVYIAIYLIA